MTEALLGEMMVMFQVDNGSLPFFQLKQLLEECRKCNSEGIHKGPIQHDLVRPLHPRCERERSDLFEALHAPPNNYGTEKSKKDCRDSLN